MAPERVGRLLLGLWEGVKSLKPWSLDWWKSLGEAKTWKQLLEEDEHAEAKEA